MLSTITWTNEGNLLSDTDNFNAVFGSQAAAARAVVRAAFASWTQVITNFNNGTNNIDISVTVSGLGTGGSASVNTIFGGRPTSGTMHLAGGDGQGGGYFIDPTPWESSEFDGNIVNAFAGDARPLGDAAGLADLYTLVVLETTHVLGLSKNQFLRIWTNNLMSNTDIPIPAGREESGPGAGGLNNTYWLFDGPSVDALFNGSAETGQVADEYNAVHTSSPTDPPVVYNGNTYYGAEDSDNAFYEIGRRYTPSRLDALILKDAYLYTITEPMQFGTFYTRLEASQFLYVATPAGNSNDTLDLRVSGGNLLVTMTLGAPVLGADPSSFTSVFPLNSVDGIFVDMGGGSDTMTLTGSIPANIYLNGGDGNDNVVLHAANNVFNDGFSIITHDVYFDGGAGFNTLTVNDATRASTQYEIYADRIRAKDTLSSAWADFEYDNINSLGIVASGSSNSASIFGVSADIPAGQQMTLLMGGGNDNVTIFPHDTEGDLTINGNFGVGGGSGTDTVTVDDTASALPINYSFYNQFGPGTTNIGGLGLAGFGAGSDFESITVNAGMGADTFDINQYASGRPLTLNAGDGDDTLNFGNNNLPANITSIASFAFDGQDGVDTFNLKNGNETNQWSYANSAASIRSERVAGATYYLLILGQANVEQLNVHAGSGIDVFNLFGVATGETLALHGGDGGDAVNLPGDLAVIQGPVYFYGDGGSNNLNHLNNSATVPTTVHIDQTSVGAFPGDNFFPAGGSLQFESLSNVVLTLGDGEDTVYAEPNSSATLSIRGGNPTSAPGDTLNLSLAGAVNYVVTPTSATDGNVTSDNLQTLTYSGFETGPNIVAPPDLPGDYNQDGSVDAGDYIVWRITLGGDVPIYSGADGSGNGSVGPEDHAVWVSHFGDTLQLEAGNVISSVADQARPTTLTALPSVALASRDEPVLPFVNAAIDPRSKLGDDLAPVVSSNPREFGQRVIHESARARAFAALLPDDSLLTWMASRNGDHKRRDALAPNSTHRDGAQHALSFSLDALDAVFQLVECLPGANLLRG